MNPLAPVAMADLALDAAGRAIAAAAEVDHELPTPCRQWDLGTLVRHVADSARTLRELLADAPAGPPPLSGCSAAQAALGELADALRHVRDDEAGPGLVVLLSNYELSLHAWDIDQATGRDTSLPPPLVEGLMAHAPLVLNHHRAGLFAPPLALTREPSHTDLDRLLAMFGRCRGWR